MMQYSEILHALQKKYDKMFNDLLLQKSAIERYYHKCHSMKMQYIANKMADERRKKVETMRISTSNTVSRVKNEKHNGNMNRNMNGNMNGNGNRNMNMNMNTTNNANNTKTKNIKHNGSRLSSANGVSREGKIEYEPKTESPKTQSPKQEQKMQFACNLCHKLFDTQDLALDHLMKVHFSQSEENEPENENNNKNNNEEQDDDDDDDIDIRNVKKDKNTKLYQCTTCNQHFSTLNSLQVHSNTHTFDRIT